MGKKKTTTRILDPSETDLYKDLPKAPVLPAPPKEKPWRAIIMYPTLAIALIGAVPQYYTLIESTFKGISSNKLRQQEHISDLWKNNLDCIKKDSIPVSDEDMEIHVRFCSASLFLIEKNKEEKSFYEWVEIDEDSTSLMDSLYAQSKIRNQNSYVTLCTSNKDNHVYQIIKDLQKSTCKLMDLDQVTGIAIRRTVDCNTKCPE